MKYRKGKEKKSKGDILHYGDRELTESSMAKYNLPEMHLKRYNNKKSVKRNYGGRILKE